MSKVKGGRKGCVPFIPKIYKTDEATCKLR